MRICDRRTAAGLALLAFAASFWQPWTLLAQAPEPARARYAQISQADLKEWLTYLASDTLQGRQVFTEGYGLASAYVADHLRSWGVKPLGDDGTYFESVKLRGYRVTRNSSVTITANGQSKTFKHGDHVSFAANSGGQQTLTFDSVEFVGYGQPADLKDRDLKSKLIAWAPSPTLGGRGRGGIAVVAIANSGAKAAVGFAPAPAPTAADQALTQAQEALQKATEAVQQAQTLMGSRGAATGRGGGFGRGRAVLPPADLTSVQRPDGIVPPQFTGDETFFEALFAAAGVKFADISAKAAKGEPLTAMSLPAKVTITIDNTLRSGLPAVDAQRRRHGRRFRSQVEEHLRAVRRAPRSRRVQPGGWGRAARAIGVPQSQRIVTRDGHQGGEVASESGPAWRGWGRTGRSAAQAVRGAGRRQQRRGRRWIGIGRDDGDRQGVRDRSPSETVGGVRVAHRRGGRPVRVAVRR